MDIIASKSKSKFSIFQAKRIEAIEEYFTSYSKAEQMWWHISVLGIFKNQIDAKEMDEMIFPSLNEVKSNALRLRLFLKNDEMTTIDVITERLFTINQTLSDLYFDDERGLSASVKSGNFHIKREAELEKNEKDIAEITVKLRASYGLSQ